jgi:NAD(P)-dependent dehydrogenase (short-subunit alcohol dehydrogenase family)
VTLLDTYLDKLRGRTAWITGGKRIGRTVARVLAEQGVNLVLSYRHSLQEASETAEAARACGIRAVTVQADVSSRASVERAVAEASHEFGNIDILINLASLYAPVETGAITERDWELNIGAHILGTFWPVQAIAPRMPRGSHIVNIADITAIGRPQKRNLPYVVTKAAVASMTAAMAADYGGQGIFVNAIAPGPIVPPPDYPRDVWERIRARSPVKVEITDQEAVNQFALLVLYLSMTTMSSGHVYPLDQGQNLW